MPRSTFTRTLLTAFILITLIATPFNDTLAASPTLKDIEQQLKALQAQVDALVQKKPNAQRTTAAGGVCENTGGVCYYVATTGSDTNDGSFDRPFKTFRKGASMLKIGDTLYIRGGTYRLTDEHPDRSNINPSGTPTPTKYIRIEGYPGERVIMFGSKSSQGVTWEKYSDQVWRVDATFLPKVPSAMFYRDPSNVRGTRITHSNVVNRQQNDDVSKLLPGTWTRADANGTACAVAAGGNNTGCFVYYYPAVPSEDPNTTNYEFPQRGLFNSDLPYFQVKGLEIYYTQNTAFAFYEGHHQIVENNIIGHNSNSADNAYAVQFWDTYGTVFRYNEVFDSRFWMRGGNSHGVTYMISDIVPDDPNIVEYNYLHNDEGHNVSTKGGVAYLVVRNNVMTSGVISIIPPPQRCPVDPCNGTNENRTMRPGGSWKIHENFIGGADIGVEIPGFSDTDNNALYNNIIFNNKNGVKIGKGDPDHTKILNNMFLDNDVAIQTESVRGGEPFFPGAYTSNNNLLHNNTTDYIYHPSTSGAASSFKKYPLAQVKTINTANGFDDESESMAVDPQVGRNFVLNETFAEGTPAKDKVSNLWSQIRSNFTLPASSPARSSGSAAFYSGYNTVDIGILPNPQNSGSAKNPLQPSVKAEQPTNSSVKLTWDAVSVSPIRSYTVYRDGTAVATNYSGKNYVDTAVTSGVTYLYQISATDSQGQESAKSVPIRVTIGGAIVTDAVSNPAPVSAPTTPRATTTTPRPPVTPTSTPSVPTTPRATTTPHNQTPTPATTPVVTTPTPEPPRSSGGGGGGGSTKSKSDRYQTTAILNVRSGPSITAPSIGTQQLGTAGTLKESPVTKDGHTWYHLNYDTGADGWSTGLYLKKISTTDTKTTVTTKESPKTSKSCTTKAKFTKNTKILITKAKTPVRDTPNGTILKGKKLNAQGTITKDPTCTDTTIWYYVDFKKGTDGYVKETRLKKR